MYRSKNEGSLKHDHGYNTHLVSVGIEDSLKNHKLHNLSIFLILNYMLHYIKLKLDVTLL